MNITSKGQVTIPKPLRDKYGLNESVEVEFVADEQGLRLVKKGGLAPFDRVYGLLKSDSESDAIVEELRGR